MLESRYREVKQCEFCGLRTDHVDEIRERAFVANVDRYATTCMNCWDEMHLHWCARTALGVAIATAAQATAYAEEHGWVMPERVERISARCFECGADTTQATLVLADDDNYNCESEYDCAQRCHANRDAER